ncbi:nicotinate-nucleotide pyrophosphorylase (carboxylating) [Streptomyces sp. V3I8]|uniref:carboxylating nicotinate-nucleotide diphosphorylase n=1 Tax=Streptomyces sp. V3I8 TaxID=3042279 RepID=UPI002784EA39|nr:carboxylating nicotinate-nucleotide diphosphorylase [Streptomyces sp. V3I8]MDQ1034631.1 nicotinate-nucleotide pyrophosphorylase (carboxylating) [Streptomyces sp. V3I8]
MNGAPVGGATQEAERGAAVERAAARWSAVDGAAVGRAVGSALAEDEATEDITTRWSVPERLRARAEIVTRQPGVVAGLSVVEAVFARVDPEVRVRAHVADGAAVAPGEVLLSLHGSARSLITGERTALNFLQRLCGIATSTRRYVEEVRGLPVRILDTRKTAPGLRALDKYAVTAGGGHNHRQHLSAMVLLKENHIAAAGGVGAAVAAVREGMAAAGREVPVEVEVETVEEAEEALRCHASWIMLDNMAPRRMERVVAARAATAGAADVLLEASGTISLDRVRTVAETGVDLISVGALTHSAPALDVSMLLTT